MGEWVVTVAGIAILSVLCDVILPEGQTRKYVKTVFGVVVTFVIVQPLLGLFSGNFSLLWSTSDGVESNIQEQYVESVNARQNQIAAKYVKSTLDADNIAVDSISVSESAATVTLKLNVSYSAEHNQKVKEVVSRYFPSYEIVTIWN